MRLIRPVKGDGRRGVRVRAGLLSVSKLGSIHLADAAERADARLFVLAVGAQQVGADRADGALEVGAGGAFVAGQRLARLQHSLQQFGGDHAGAFAGASWSLTGSPSRLQSR